jgi:hypothetical protein
VCVRERERERERGSRILTVKRKKCRSHQFKSPKQTILVLTDFI